MGRASALSLFILLLAAVAVQSLLLTTKGGLYVNQHEGDTLHLLQILLRMSEGEWPHLDFMTPLGVMSFAPMSMLIGWGIDPGQAILWAQMGFALVLLPAVWWAGATRLSPTLALILGLGVVVLATALVHGGAKTFISISMHYNRWGWAVAFVLSALVMLPSQRNTQAVDGVILGAGLSFLALAKVTFFLGLFPAILVGLLLRRQFTALGVGILVGGLAIVWMTLAAGPAFWPAYLSDLQTVRGSGLRSAPSAPLAQLIYGPKYLALNGLLIGTVLVLRQAGREVEAVIMLLLAPGFVYITYQNWGNDPKWLFLIAIFLIGLRPDRPQKGLGGIDVSTIMAAMALAASVIAFPSWLNMSLSTWRHWSAPTEGYEAMTPATQRLLGKTSRNYRQKVTERRLYGVADLDAKAGDLDNPEVLMGRVLPDCKLSVGLVGYLEAIAVDLEANGLAEGKTIFVADTFSNLWLFGPSRPLPGGAPWYYGDLTPLETADYVLIPDCRVATNMRRYVVEEIEKRPEMGFSVRHRGPGYTLLDRAP